MAALLAWSAGQIWSMGQAQAQDLVENGFLLPVAIEGQIYRLEAYMARPKAVNAPAPLVVISHGTNGDITENETTHASNFRLIVRDFARRGWVAVAITRRGFGVSEGQLPLLGACGATLGMTRVIESYAGDVLAAVEVLAKWPSVDASRVMFVGASTGGITSLMAASRYKGGKAWAVNVSGGMKSARCLWEEPLAAVFAEAGKNNLMRSMWFYAENDSFFRPLHVERFVTAFRRAGGDARLKQFGPVGEDGHYIFTDWKGREKWLPELDRFLAENGLPHMKDADIETLVKRLKFQGKQKTSLELYAQLPGEKVLVISGSGDSLFWNYGGGSVSSASQKALESCNAKHKACRVVLINNDFSPGQAPVEAAPAR